MEKFKPKNNGDCGQWNWEENCEFDVNVAQTIGHQLVCRGDQGQLIHQLTSEVILIRLDQFVEEVVSQGIIVTNRDISR